MSASADMVEDAASYIAASTDIHDLMHRLTWLCDNDLDAYLRINMTKLPTWGPPPLDPAEVWSWSDRWLLCGQPFPLAGFCIISRGDF